MPKIFKKPSETKGRGWEPHKRPTLGSGPAGPSAQADNRINFVLILVAFAILLVALAFKGAWGEELQGDVGQLGVLQQFGTR
jgi:hypothetical protein